MISIADIKSVLTTASNYATSADDLELIQDKIDLGYSYIGSQSTLSLAASGDSFEEYCEVYKNEFWLSLKQNDIQLISITGYDSDDTEYTLSVSDIVKKSNRLYREEYANADIVRVKVQYNSTYGLRAVKEIIKDIAVFEIKRTATKTGALTKTGEGAGDITINFVKPKDFYDEIDRRIDGLILRGL